MKSLNKLLLASAVLIALFISGCKDDAYITDGGISNTATPLSNYDYLKSSPQFDTLLLIVDHFGLKDSLNNAATFYAFSDYTAIAFMRTIDVASIDQLYDSVSSKFITQYMFSDKIALSDVSLLPVRYKNLAEPDSANCAISKAAYKETINLTNSAASFTYYQMQYLKVNGAMDGTPEASPGDPTDVTLRCQTSDIKTNSGKTLLHIFSNNVTLRKL